MARLEKLGDQFVFAFLQLLRTSLSLDTSFIEEGQPVGNRSGAVKIVGNNNRGDFPFPLQSDDQIVDPAMNNRIESCCRLIAEKDVGLNGESAS